MLEKNHHQLALWYSIRALCVLDTYSKATARETTNVDDIVWFRATYFKENEEILSKCPNSLQFLFHTSQQNLVVSVKVVFIHSIKWKIIGVYTNVSKYNIQECELSTYLKWNNKSIISL